MYKILRSILFRFDAEKVHHFSMEALRFCCRLPLGHRIMSNIFTHKDPALERVAFGLRFRNPVGLAAGFDKNARYLRELSALGFGFVEIGTVTPKPQAGNDMPRLFRLPADKALINRMGFNNDGVEMIAERLATWRSNTASQYPADRLIVGGNIGKNKVTANEDAWKDYEICFRRLHSLVDYFVVNVSSPNTPGLRELQEKDALSKILSNLQRVNHGMAIRKPLLLKIAPDLTPAQLDDIITLAEEVKLDGLVAANTTISRSVLSDASKKKATEIGAGGLSGAPLSHRSSEILRHITDKSDGRLPVIASGGIFSGADALEKLSAGAVLVQIWTGFVYEGPMAAARICKTILRST